MFEKSGSFAGSKGLTCGATEFSPTSRGQLCRLGQRQRFGQFRGNYWRRLSVSSKTENLIFVCC